MAKDIVLGKTRINWARDASSGIVIPEAELKAALEGDDETGVGHPRRSGRKAPMRGLHPNANLPTIARRLARGEPKIVRLVQGLRSIGDPRAERIIRLARQNIIRGDDLEGSFAGDEEIAAEEAGNLERAAMSRTSGHIPEASRRAHARSRERRRAKDRRRAPGAIIRGSFVGTDSLRSKVVKHVAPENRSKASTESDAKLRETVTKMQDGLAKLAEALKGRTPIPIAKADYDRYAAMARSGNMPAATYVEVMERFISSGKVRIDPAGLTGPETKELVATGKLPSRLKVA